MTYVVPKTPVRPSNRPFEGLVADGVVIESAMTSKSQSDASIIDADALAIRPNHLEGEYELAAHLQEDFLRSVSPIDLAVDLYTVRIAAGETCGDAIEVFRLDADHVAVFLVDATGHGLAAAHLAALALQTIRSWMAADCQELLRNPGQVLTKLNELLYQSNSRDCFFIAATYAVYHEPTGTVRLARGGSPYPICCNLASQAKRITTEGPLVGILKEAQFETIELSLAPGDQLMIFSDGLEDSGLPEELFPFQIQVAGPPTSPHTSEFFHAVQPNYPAYVGPSISPAHDVSVAIRKGQDEGTPLTRLESEVTRRAEIGQLHDDVTVVLLRIPLESSYFVPAAEERDTAKQLTLV